jgi:hypothetical protein
MNALKLLLVEETKKLYRLKDVYEETFGKPFDEKEVEQELKKEETTPL